MLLHNTYIIIYKLHYKLGCRIMFSNNSTKYRLILFYSRYLEIKCRKRVKKFGVWSFLKAKENNFGTEELLSKN